MKKGFRYVLLALCCMALVFQPVKSFAFTSYTYDDFTDFTTAINDYIKSNTTITQNKVSTISDQYNTLPSYKGADYLANTYDFALDEYYYVSTSTYVYALEVGYWKLVVSTESNTASMYANSGGNAYRCNSPLMGSPSAATSLNISSLALGNSVFLLFYKDVDYAYLDVSNYADSSIVNKYIFTTTPQFNPPIVTPDPSNPSDNNSSYPLNIYYQLAYMISENFRSFTPSGTPINKDWIGVGEYLTINYLGLQDLTASNVTYYDRNGDSTIAANPYYYFYHKLDSIFQDIDDIMLAVDDLGDNLTYLSDINDRLEVAFPDDLADMNDSIADTVLDDSNGTGLTISKVTSTKSDLDDGISTFEVDTTGITWSNPFTALLNLDWAWFSQTTAQNLQSLDSGSLQSELDYSELQYYNSVNSYYNDGN